MDSILVLDPGNSTGWFYRNAEGEMFSGTIKASHADIYDLIDTLKPNTIVYETFQLYPSRAQKMSWNSFYPCEVIGIIKVLAVKQNCRLVGLQPSVKKYATAPTWENVQLVDNGKVTEHMRDAWRLFDYYIRNKK